MKSNQTEESLTRAFVRFRDRGDSDALAEVFDNSAPSLYRLGLHLLGDPAEAEDLVQQTFVIAIEKAHRFRDDGAIRPWLIGILARNAKAARRRRKRRPPAEERALPAADQPALDSETRQFLAGALETLGPPYREVVAAWLDGGKPPREIARELGRAPSRVRLQLHRGLKLLRGRLPRGLSLTALFAMPVEPRGLEAVRIFVLARGCEATGAITSSTLIGWLAQGSGGMAMKKLGVLLVVLLFAGATLLMTRDPDPVENPETTAALEPVEPAGPAFATAPTTSPPVRAAVEPPTDPLRLQLVPPKRPEGEEAMIGRVISDTNGSPIEGATIQVRASRNWPPRYSWETTTDTNGDFKLGSMDLRGGCEMSIHADGFAFQRVHYEARVRDSPVVDGASDLGEIRLVRGEIIEGVVIEADGTPSPGAALFVHDRGRLRGSVFLGSLVRPTGRADEHGRFRIADVAADAQPGSVQLMAATGRGIGVIEVPVTHGMQPASEEVIQIAPSARVEIDVVDESGAPVSGASVVAEPRFDRLIGFYISSLGNGTYEGPQPVHGMWLGPHGEIHRWFQGTSDSAGRVTLDQLPVPPPTREDVLASWDGTVGPFDLVVTREGFEPAFMDNQFLSPERPTHRQISLVRQRWLTLAGSVIDDDGAPVPGAMIGLRPATQPSTADRARPAALSGKGAPTDEDGRFVVHGVPGGTAWTVSASKDGFVPDSVVVPYDSEAESPLTLRLTRRPTQETISGRLIDQHGQPIPGVVLVVERPAQGKGRPGSKTDTEGRFEITTPFPGRQALKTLNISNPVSRFVDPNQEFEVEAGDRELELVLARSELGICELTLLVVDAQDRSPLSMNSAWLFSTPDDSTQRAKRPTVYLGKVVVDAVPAGAWRLTADSETHGEIEHVVDVPAGVVTHVITVEVPSVGTVHGRITWEQGNPGPVTVALSRPVFLADKTRRGYFTTTPGEPFTLDAPPGPLRLALSSRFAYGEAEVEVVSGEDREVVIRGGRGGQLQTVDLAKTPPASSALQIESGHGAWRTIAIHRQRTLPGGRSSELASGVAPGSGRWRVTRMEDADTTSDPATWPILAEGEWSVEAGETVELHVP